MDNVVTAAAFILLWSQWETGGVALPLSSVYDIHFTTPPSSSVVLIQNDVLYREHKKERGKRKERTLIIIVWRMKRCICPRDDRHVSLSRTSRKYNITYELYDARRTPHTQHLIRILCLSAHSSSLYERDGGKSTEEETWICELERMSSHYWHTQYILVELVTIFL
jgi:hypothetical protein